MADDGLHELHSSRGSEAQTLETIIEWSRGAIGGTDAGIFLLDSKGQIEAVVPTSDEVAKAHLAQLELDEGPCLQVIRGQIDAILIGDTATDRRFPLWGPQASQMGFRSVVSVMLETQDKRFGSLNVYSTARLAFDHQDLETIAAFAPRAARAMAVANDAAHLEIAVDGRNLVGQAQGILMERLKIDADRAFEYLARESQHRNVKLRVIAEWIVTHRHDKQLRDLDL